MSKGNAVVDFKCHENAVECCRALNKNKDQLDVLNFKVNIERSSK